MSAIFSGETCRPDEPEGEKATQADKTSAKITTKSNETNFMFFSKQLRWIKGTVLAATLVLRQMFFAAFFDGHAAAIDFFFINVIVSCMRD